MFIIRQPAKFCEKKSDEGQERPICSSLKKVFCNGQIKIDDRYVTVYASFSRFKTKFVGVMVVLFDESISVFLYHFGIPVFILFLAIHITVFCYIFPGKNPVKLVSVHLAQLPFSQTREVGCNIYALQHSVGLIVRLCFKFHLTGSSRSMVFVIICKYQIFC